MYDGPTKLTVSAISNIARSREGQTASISE